MLRELIECTRADAIRTQEETAQLREETAAQRSRAERFRRESARLRAEIQAIYDKMEANQVNQASDGTPPQQELETREEDDTPPQQERETQEEGHMLQEEYRLEGSESDGAHEVRPSVVFLLCLVPFYCCTSLSRPGSLDKVGLMLDLPLLDTFLFLLVSGLASPLQL